MSKAAYGNRGDKAQKRRERDVIKLIAEENARGYGRDSWIADTLNGRGYKSPGGSAWSAMAVRRVIETPRWSKIMEKAIEATRPAPYNGCCGPDVDKHKPNVVHGLLDAPVEFTYTNKDGKEKTRLVDVRLSPSERLTAEEEQRKQEQFARAAEREKQRQALIAVTEHRFLNPDDSRSWGVDELGEHSEHAPLWTKGYHLFTAKGHLNHLSLAGKDTWRTAAVDALVVELAKNTGKDAHALLDAVEPPAVKAQLRRVVYGLMRGIGLQRQLNLALRQALKANEGAFGLDRAEVDAMLGLDVMDGAWGARRAGRCCADLTVLLK